MSEKEPEDSRDTQPEQAEVEKFNRFLARVNANGRCPVCGNGTWSLLGASDVVPVLPVTMREARGIPLGGGGYTLYAAACNRCGFIRSHLGAIVNGDVVLPTDSTPLETKE